MTGTPAATSDDAGANHDATANAQCSLRERVRAGVTYDMPVGPMPPPGCQSAVGDAAGGAGYDCCPCGGAGDAGAH